MRSFKDKNGNNIPFESKYNLTLELLKDIETGEVTGYLVHHDDNVYEVSKKTYEAIENL